MHSRQVGAMHSASIFGGGVLATEIPAALENRPRHVLPVLLASCRGRIGIGAPEVRICPPRCSRHSEVIRTHLLFRECWQSFGNQLLELTLGHLLGFVRILAKTESHQSRNISYSFQVQEVWRQSSLPDILSNNADVVLVGSDEVRIGEVEHNLANIAETDAVDGFSFPVWEIGLKLYALGFEDSYR